MALQSARERDILKVLLYFDVFDHPLTAEEIYTFLPSNSTSPGEINKLCHGSSLKQFVTSSGKYFHMIHAPSRCVKDRFAKEKRAHKRWRIARAMAAVIRQFPFVRGVFVSGELSKGVAREDGDVDFFIITADSRLWICRTLLILFKKLILFNSKKYFCLNHFITESNLVVEERNLYSALEIATIKPLHNTFLYHRYLRRNLWISDFFPNLTIPSEDTENRGPRRSLLQIALEFPWLSPLADRSNERLRRAWEFIWKRRYPILSEEKRRELYRCDVGMSTAYAGDFLTKVLDEYRARLKMHGLDTV